MIPYRADNKELRSVQRGDRAVLFRAAGNARGIPGGIMRASRIIRKRGKKLYANGSREEGTTRGENRIRGVGEGVLVLLQPCVREDRIYPRHLSRSLAIRRGVEHRKKSAARNFIPRDVPAAKGPQCPPLPLILSSCNPDSCT